MDVKSYKCDMCKDLGWIYELNEYPHKCGCYNKYLEVEKNKKIKELFSEAYSCYSIDSFIADTQYQKAMKKIVKKYIETKGINSILLLGQSGSGKTHLAVAIAKVFIERGAWIELMPYAEEITKIKQDVLDKGKYDATMYKYKNCDYLIIDDFLKGTVKNRMSNEKDFKYVYEIIDCRYKYRKPVIITSEFFIDEIQDLDEAIAGRLKEMSTQNDNNFVVQIQREKERNYRMRGIEKL